MRQMPSRCTSLRVRSLAFGMVTAADGTESTEDSSAGLAGEGVLLRAILPGDSSVWAVRRGEVVLGRDPGCDLLLQGSRVSRRHAQLRRTGQLLTIRDLESTNGTYIHGQRVGLGALAPHAVLRLGDWLGMVECVPNDAGLGQSFGELARGLWGGTLLARALARTRNVARTALPVVLVGASGTGKEGFARAIHASSGRTGPFHALNCAALPSSLAEAELFGYRRGAFTGAERSHIGHLRAAEGGSLFLDEIAELAWPLQAKLLRAIETREMIPVGETNPVKFNARLIAATQRPLCQLVADELFREDLAMRLGGATIEVPTLRERRGDIPNLFSLFMREHLGGMSMPISSRVHERLCLHEWPGNVRELRFVAAQAAAEHSLEPLLRPSHLPDAIRGTAAPAVLQQVPLTGERPGAGDRRRDDMERLAAALERSQGNVQRAAGVAGISRQRAYRLIAGRTVHRFLSDANQGRMLTTHESGD